MDKRLILTVGYVITGVWLISSICSIVIRDYNPDESIHLLMMIVAGAAFGGSIKLPVKGRQQQLNGNGANANDK